MKVDNFALEQFTCPAKFDLRIRKGYVPLRRKASLSFGAAVHIGLAEWYRTGNVKSAMELLLEHWPEVMPSDDFRTREYALKVLARYAQEYPKESWELVQGPEGPIIEQAFTLPTGLQLECQVCLGAAEPSEDVSETRCPQGHPLEDIVYGGILDLPVQAWGTVYIVDHKTTTVLGKDDSSYYFTQFKPDNQMTGYIWGVGKLTNQRVGGAIVNAIGLYKSGEVRFKRHITSRNGFETAEWLIGVRERCNEIKRCERSGIWRLETSKCTEYGLCEYHSVHVLNDHASREKRLEQDYTRSPWNYESRDD